MIAMLEHRGPERVGIYESARASLAHARLSIIDLEGGLQPIPNEDGTIWLVCNGEFYNYIELGRQLVDSGHRFRTQSDSEVLIHLYEDLGWRAVAELNGEYAFALWDERQGVLWLGRDRLGVRPLSYAIHAGRLLFASEIKALFAAGVPRAIDHHSLAQVFSFWAPLPGRTVFTAVRELPPAHVAEVHVGEPEIRLRPYWRLAFPSAPQTPSVDATALGPALRELLADAVRIRLRADVPVGAYLSGGLDSSLVTGLARAYGGDRLHTFSIAFQDAEYDERQYQYQVARALGTTHHVVDCTAETVWSALPDVVWHTEVPILRLSPVPLFLLSRLVRDHGLKVVLTGEGADEFFGGYDIFKEAMVRRFWARVPDSGYRFRLLERIYPHIGGLHSTSPAMLKAFFGQGLSETASPCYSHLLRWRNTFRISRLFSRSLAGELQGYNVEEEVEPLLPAEITSWDAVAQAQYLEVTTFLSTYLLSSQGDRMSMAHAVEGRYPFLDPRVVEFAAQMPRAAKIRALRSEKIALRRAAWGLVPEEVSMRPKQAYRAPIRSAFAAGLPDYASESLSPTQLARAGCFEPSAVDALVRKACSSAVLGEVDQMALVGILTCQLLHEQFVAGWSSRSARRRWVSDAVDVRALRYDQEPGATALASRCGWDQPGGPS